jgi:Secretion system C-terminal sorting domain
MEYNMKNILNFKFTILVIIVAAFSSNILYSQEISYGDSAALGNGIVKTWLITDTSDNPRGIGLSLSEDVLTNLPLQSTAINPPGRSFPYDVMYFPPKVNNTVFDHNLFLWLPQGHNPEGIYDVPQFNAHFNIISPEERETIPGETDTFSVDPRFIPQDYEFAFHSRYVGNHWWDTTAAELHGQVFTKTLLYGYSKGKFVFYELAVSKAFLETNPHFSEIIKQPAEFQLGGYYPTTYKIEYDSVNHTFNLELTDFVFRQAVTGVDDLPNNNIPEKFALYQNYPNPFNPSTTIRWQSPIDSWQTLKIYDILGNEKAKLIDEQKPAGIYKVDFDATGLPSGVYFYKIQAGSFVETKKMILLK